MNNPSASEVGEKIQTIKTMMPQTYRSILARSLNPSSKAHAAVRRALRGEPNLFYAIEAGYVVGTPFDHGYVGKPLQDQVAATMVNFGCAHVCIWGEAIEKAQHGSN